MTTANKGDFAHFGDTSWAKIQAHWTVQDFDTGALPQFECPAAFCNHYRAFLQKSGNTAEASA
jgi:hypothetical protein